MEASGIWFGALGPSGYSEKMVHLAPPRKGKTPCDGIFTKPFQIGLIHNLEGEGPFPPLLL